MFSVFLFLAAAPFSNALAAAQAQDAGVAAISYRLQVRSLPLCPAPAPLTGLVIHDITQYPASEKATARIQFALGDAPGILAVVPGSAAARAGLRVNDAIIAVGGIPAPRGAPDALETMLDRVFAKGPADIAINRGGTPLTIRMAASPGCRSRVQVIPGNALTRQADGLYVQITGAVLGEVESDDELAGILAHELAHNVLKHRLWLDANGRSTKNILRTEIEADKLSVYIVALAGYDPLAPARFRARFGKKSGFGIFSDGTHERTAARVVTLTSVAREIAAKRASGKAILPDYPLDYPRAQ
jgi:beta-barrel assembly-enhancing protease